MAAKPTIYLDFLPLCGKGVFISNSRYSSAKEALRFPKETKEQHPYRRSPYPSQTFYRPGDVTLGG